MTTTPHPSSQASVDRWQADLLQAANRRTAIYQAAVWAALAELEPTHPAAVVLLRANLDAAVVRP